MAWKKFLVAGAIVLGGIAVALTQPGPDAVGPDGPSVYPRVARRVAEDLPEAHLSHGPLGDAIAEKAFENYLKTLDPDRSYFLASDVEEFRKRVPELDDQLRQGRVDFAFVVFDRLKQRAGERLAQVEALLARGFDLTRQETYWWDREEAEWPAGPAEQDELWRKKVKNELVARLAVQQLKEEEEAGAAEAAEEAEEAAAAAGRPDDEDLPPDELVGKRYRQFNTVLEGHDEEWVLQAYLNAFTQAYDTHSAYLSPRANEDFDIAMKLSLTGIGAVLSYDDGAAKIERLIAGGPAEQDGRLKPGDRIVAVAQDGEDPVDISFWPLYKSVRLIRGEQGTRVRLHVIPASDPTGANVRVIDMVRETIKLEERAARSEIRTVPVADGSDPVRLGVLTLPDFYADQQGIRSGDETSRSASVDVRRLLNELKEQNVEGIILDLRNNGGGSLQEAIELTGFFIESGPVVQVKANRRVQVLRDPDPDIVYDGPLVVLVNRLSASASEILAGALQDYERAVVVGDSRTHGKGSVQSVFPLDRFNEQLGALKITTAGFYRVSGQSTQLKGVEPDIVLPSPLDVMEIGEEFLANVMPWSWVAPASYRKHGDLTDRIARLQAESGERLGANPDFGAYREKLDRLKARLDRKEVSLNLDERLAQSRVEKELDELQERLTAELRESAGVGTEEDAEQEEVEDLVLNEALLILRDLVRGQTLQS